MKRKPYRPRICSISCGTLRTEDLIDAILWELRGAALTRTQRDEVRNAERLRDAEEMASDHDEQLQWAYEALSEIMDDLAPPYAYFGMHDGDGSDLGFWPLWDAIEEDRRNGDLPEASNLPAGYRGLYCVVSDHGNFTLMQRYRGGTRELWACV